MSRPTTREELEKQIAAVSQDIDILNGKIADIVALAEERDRLRKKLDELLSQLSLVKGAGLSQTKTPEVKTVFLYKGKVKDLNDALAHAMKLKHNWGVGP